MKNLKNKIKNMKGITLISLVITIVVLIILAGITLNMLLGENGIINRTKTAKEEKVDSAPAQGDHLPGPGRAECLLPFALRPAVHPP